jgi:hypothetical protein
MCDWDVCFLAGIFVEFWNFCIALWSFVFGRVFDVSLVFGRVLMFCWSFYVLLRVSLFC